MRPLIKYNPEDRIYVGKLSPLITALCKSANLLISLTAKKMTGDDTFQEVRSILSQIEHAPSVINDSLLQQLY